MIKLSCAKDSELLQHPRWSNVLSAVNYYHKELHLGCCNSPRFASKTI